VGKPKVAVGLAIPPKPPLGALKQVIWATRALRCDSLLLWDHLQDLIPTTLWDKQFTWAAGDNDSPHAFFDQQTLLGYMAPRAGRMAVGVAVTEAIRRHPVVIAQAMVTLAHLGKRAPILGIGSGEKENIEPYGLSFANPVSKLEEALQVLRLCFYGKGPLNFEGKHFSLRDARFDLKAPKGRTPQIWVGALGPRMLELTGRYGDGWYPLGLLTPEEYGQKLEAIRSAARAAGRKPDDVLPAFQPYIVIAPTHQEAARMLENPTIKFFALLAPAEAWRKVGVPHPFGDDYKGNAEFLPESHTRAELEAAIAKVPVEVAKIGLLWGTPDEVVEQLRPFAAAGMRYVVPQALTAAISRKHAMYSLRALRTIRLGLNT
jgi:phthiodiolone/phenolphthiodiolone dimycocerosates ketoreductase